MTTHVLPPRGERARPAWAPDLARWQGTDPAAAAPAAQVGLEVLRAFLDTGRVEGWNDLPRRDRGTLTALGWLDDAGATTELGAQARANLGAGARTLHLRSHDEATRVRGFVLVGAETALVAREAARAAGRPDDGDDEGYRGDVVVDLVPVGALPLVLARWGGVRPTPHVVGETFRLGDGRALARRLRDASARLPEEADADLADVWSQPWTWWSVRTDEGEIELTYVDAGRAGQFAVRENGAALVRRPESLVWGELQRLPARLAALGGEPDPDGSDW